MAEKQCESGNEHDKNGDVIENFLLFVSASL